MRYSCLLQTSLQAVYLCTYTWIVHGTLRQRHWYSMPVFDLSELGMIVKSVLGKFFFHGFIKFFVQNVKAEEKFEISDILLWSDKIAGLVKYRNSLLFEILSNIKIFRVIQLIFTRQFIHWPFNAWCPMKCYVHTGYTCFDLQVS